MLTISHRIQQNSKKQHLIRRLSVAAAVLALLISTVVAAKLFPDWGEPEMSQFSVSMDDGSTNTHISMQFDEAFVATDAPDHIETFYMPECSDILAANTFVSSTTSVYYPFHSADFPTPNDPIPVESIIETNFEWNTDETTVSYAQRALKSGKLSGINWVYAAEAEPKLTTETFTIDSYDIFCVAIEAYDFTTYNWFWTDGAYLFSLSSTTEDMTEVLRSVQPVEDMTPYLQPDK